MHYPIPKGVFDILPQELKEEDSWRTSDRWQHVEAIIRKTAHDYGFKEIRTPVFERTELFVRGVGEASDIVSKEMYTFQDKAERSLSLRPEGTASVIRAFVEKNLHTLGGLHKFYYIAPMFRYERPQAGRYRQHHQFGVEAIGIKSPEQDVEVIDLLCELYRRLGLKELVVMVNTLGDEASRTAYRSRLTEYLRPRFEELSADSQARFSKNVLRILDSKDPKDQEILSTAPSLYETLSEESRLYFMAVCRALERLHISYEINPRLVRGLDYYNHTVFEVTSNALGAQNSIGGGGRYDGLISAFGGPDLPSVGFGTGIERILHSMIKQGAPFPSPPHPVIFLIPMGEQAKELCFSLLCQLRHLGIGAEIDLSGKKVGAALQLANILKADYAAVVGEEELATQTVHIKKMATREVFDVRLSNFISNMQELIL